jgi:propanol-preferring alcohol dehydrogenase
VVLIPDGVSFVQAAVTTDSVAMAYYAVAVEACVAASMPIAVVGLGGLGMNGVTIAALQGATVRGVDIDSQKFEDAKRCGATACATSLGAYSNVEFDAVIDFAGIGSTTAEAIVAVKAGGCIVLVGLGASEVRASTTAFALRGITLRGSIGASLGDLSTVFVLTATGSITPVFTEISLRRFMKDWSVLIEVKSVVAFLPGRRKDDKSRVCGGIFRQNVCRVPVC